MPDEQGHFEYVDDFDSPRFLEDAYCIDLGAEQWTPGAITNNGPYSRALIYRFHGDRAIESIEVQVDQSANARHLGGRNTLSISTNGLDWKDAAMSDAQDADAAGWQRAPLLLSGPDAARYIGPRFRGGREIWIRIRLHNNSGLKTNVSNRIEAVRVDLRLGAKVQAEGVVGAGLRTRWAKQRRASGWRSFTLDWQDPVGLRPPHYFEDADGWLAPAFAGAAGADPFLVQAEEGFRIGRAYRDGFRIPLALAAFVRTEATGEAIMIRLRVRCDKNAHRELQVLWDGAPAATFDAARYVETDVDFFVDAPGPHRAGTHELRIAGLDADRTALLRRIEVVGAGVQGWGEKQALPAGGKLEILSAYFMPDPPPPPASQAVEGRQKVSGLMIAKMQQLYEDHADFGAIRVIYRNAGAVPIRLDNTIYLNGRPVEEAYVDFEKSAWDARGVVWYRMWPRTLPPGACGQAYIRFRRRPAGDEATLALRSENAPPISITIPYVDPGVRVDYVTAADSGKTLYVYVRRVAHAKPVELATVRLDGNALEKAKIYGADFPGNIALAVVRLDHPLEPGAYHVAGIETSEGVCVAAQFRVLPQFFPRSSIHVPVAEAKRRHMNLLTWRMHALETCEEHDLPTTCMHSDVLHMHRRVALIFAPDEPDAKDNRGGGYDRGLGWHARMLEQSGWQALVAQHTPPVASWMNMDGTVRPLNWAVYGLFGDVNGFDPYPVTYYAADHAYVRESLSYARLCCAPTPMYAILEAYGWRSGQGVPKNARGPLPEEYRQNLVQAIGTGMKGLTSWVHSAAAGGWALNEAFAEEIERSNALLEHIEQLLLIGTPIDLAASDAGLVPTGTVGQEHWPKERVWVGSLLCGPDALVIAAANHIPASKPDPPTILPTRAVTISVRLPRFLTDIEAFEATEHGLASFPCQSEDGAVRLTLDAIATGRVFVLRRADI